MSRHTRPRSRDLLLARNRQIHRSRRRMVRQQLQGLKFLRVPPALTELVDRLDALWRVELLP